VACPFFVPEKKLENGGWPHPARLPLGGGWTGSCCAPGHQGESLSDEELRDYCNLGYAEGCARLPAERAWDAVRFAIISQRTRDSLADDRISGSRIQLRCVCERNHRPASHATVEFDLAKSRWIQRHADPRVQRLAECYLAECLNRSRNENFGRAASGSAGL